MKKPRILDGRVLPSTYRKIYEIYIHDADEKQFFITTDTIGADMINDSDEKKWKWKLARAHCGIRS